MRARAVLVTIGVVSSLVAAAGCQGQAGGRRPLGGAEVRQVEDCLRGLEAIAGAEPELRAELLAQASAEACGRLPGFDGLANADASLRVRLLVEKTDFLCKGKDVGPAMSVDPREKYRRLAEICGAAYYGLAPGEEGLLSPRWFVVQRVGAWLAGVRARADSGLAARLDGAMAALRFPLQLPARVEGRYELPAAGDLETRASAAYVVVGGDALSVGAAPEAALTPAGARVAYARGGAFPGTPVALEELEARVAELAGAPVATDEPVHGGTAAVAARRVPLDAASAANAGATPRQGEAAAEGPPRDLAVLKVLGARGGGVTPSLLGELEHLDVRSPAAPLLLADGHLPAARLIEVARRLPRTGAAIGVAGRDGATALGVRFAGRSPAALAVAPVPALHLVLRPAGYLVVSPAGAGREIPKVGDAYDVRALREVLAGADLGQLRVLHVSAEPGPTVEVLVEALAKAAEEAETIVAEEPGAALASASPAPGDGRFLDVTGGLGGDLGRDGLPGASGGAFAKVHDQDGPRIVPSPDAGARHGSIDKGAVKRAVQAGRNRLRLCYERQLAVDPTLAGRVVARFTIGPDGAVTEATASGLGAPVDACVADAVRRMRFPKPEGGGVVNVTFPFVFGRTE